MSVTLDELANGKRLVIIDEVALPVRFALMARPGTGMAGVTPPRVPSARARAGAPLARRNAARTPPSSRPRPRRVPPRR